MKGWEDRRFYPDFLAFTNKENIIAIEWKGEHLSDAKDTKYKESLGKVWEELGKGKLHFFLSSSKTLDGDLKKIRNL